MGIHIQKVEIDAAGPVGSFREELAPLTLVYARNERGKTTIVENLVAALFRDRKDGTYPPLRRDLIGAARVTVGGISSRPEQFSPLKGRKKLDDLIDKGKYTLPPSLFSLLVIKGAEPEISEASGGISRSLLKKLVSRQRVYEALKENLPTEIGYTDLQDGLLVAQKRIGGYKNYESLNARLESLEQAAEAFYSSLSRSELTSLLAAKELLEKEREQQRLARRHAAFSFRRQIEETDREIARYRGTDFERLSAEVRDYLRSREEVARLEKETGHREKIEQDLRWLEAARDRYERCRSGPSNLARRISLLAAALFLLGSLAAYFLLPALLPLGLLLSLIGFAFLLVFSFAAGRGRTPQAAGAELEEIRHEFSRRFGRELRTPVDFAVAKSEQDRELGRTHAAQSGRDEAASAREKLQRQISGALFALGYPEAAESDWSTLVQQLKQQAADLNIRRHRLEERLGNLDVDESDYLEQDPGVEYSRQRETKLEEELGSLREKTELEEEKARGLRERLIEHIGREAARVKDLEAVAEAIEEARQALKGQAREALAEMIAGHVVAGVLEEFLKKEDEQLEAAVNDSQASALIEKFTGRYNRIVLQGEQLYIENEQESYSLAEMSTGAREQILLALRLGIAMTLCGKQALFLILDDAFQHSDWQRRQALVEQSLDIVRSGWQVIYFTMDDDIRDRFLKAAAGLEKRSFKLIEL